jgi:hypothetical protein
LVTELQIAKEMMELAFKKLEREYISSGASLGDLQFVGAVFSAAEDHGNSVRIIARPLHGLTGATSNESTHMTRVDRYELE